MSRVAVWRAHGEEKQREERDRARQGARAPRHRQPTLGALVPINAAQNLSESEE
jgi:hypothetical protein